MQVLVLVQVLKMVKQIATNFRKHKTVFHKIFFLFTYFFLLFMSIEFDKFQKSGRLMMTKEWHYTK